MISAIYALLEALPVLGIVDVCVDLLVASTFAAQ